MQDLGIRQFLLTNLDRSDPAGPYEFRLPLEILSNALGEIGEFPYAPGEKVWTKPALFLKGAFGSFARCGPFWVLARLLIY